MFVGNVADDLFENILERDEAQDHAIFVDDQREMGLALQKGLKLVLQACRIGHKPGIERDILDLHMRDVAARILERAQQILGVQHADDVVGLAAPDRHARIGRADNRMEKLARRQIGVDRVHFRPVDHHVLDGEFAEIEQAAEHIAFRALHAAFPVHEIDGAFQFLMAGQKRVVDSWCRCRRARSRPWTRVSIAASTGPKTATKKPMIGADDQRRTCRDN